MVQPTTPKLASWKFLRRKLNPLTADPAWVASNLDPDTHTTVTVGGTASNGNYVITLTGTDIYGDAVSQTITFNRAAAETNSGIATGLEAAAQALIDGGTLSSSLVDVTVSGAVVTFVFQEDADVYISALTAPGTGTLTASGGDGKVTKGIGFVAPSMFSPRGRVEVRVFVCDSNGIVLDIDQAAVTMTLEAIDVVRSKLLGTDEIVGPLIVNSVAEDDVPAQRPVFFDCSGSEGFTVRITNVASDGGGDQFIVMYREAV